MVNSVKLVQKGEEGKIDVPICVLSFKEGQTLADFRLRCASAVDFDFDFWDDRLPRSVKSGVEKLIEVSELEGLVYVIEQKDSTFTGRVTQVSSHSSVATTIPTVSTFGDTTLLPQAEKIQVTTHPIKASFESCLMFEVVAKI